MTKYILTFLMCIWAGSGAMAAPDICTRLAVHVPDAGILHVGDHAVPADIYSINGAIAPVHIPITVDLAERYGLVLPSGVELDPDAAEMDIYPDGRIEYNGEDIAGHMAEICAQNESEPADVNGQADDDVLKSEPQIIEVKEGVYGEVLDGEHSE